MPHDALHDAIYMAVNFNKDGSLRWGPVRYTPEAATRDCKGDEAVVLRFRPEYKEPS